MDIKVPDMPPKDFSTEGLTHDLVVPISSLNGKTAMYYKCKADSDKETSVQRAVCDIVYVHLDENTGRTREITIGKAYFVEGDRKYRVILPKHIWMYSGWPEEETSPLDGDWGTAKWVIVDHNL